MMLRAPAARPPFRPPPWPKFLPDFLPETPAGAGPDRRLEGPAPVLADEIGAKAVVRLLVPQAESGPLVDAPGLGQHAVGPQHDLGVARGPGEPQALLDQLRADAQAPCGRVHVQQP